MTVWVLYLFTLLVPVTPTPQPGDVVTADRPADVRVEEWIECRKVRLEQNRRVNNAGKSESNGKEHGPNRD